MTTTNIRALKTGKSGLQASNLCKTVGKKVLLKDISISVHRGEVVALLGPNGAGKTTCFHAITGLIEATTGHVAIENRDVTQWPVYRRARAGLGYLPQESSIFRGLTVEENIRAILEVVEPDKAAIQERLTILLNDFGLTRIKGSPAPALSGGERRRVEIARALASRPTYMLLDEPFAGVDPIVVGDIRDLVADLKNRGIGVLITDHNVRETLAIVDRAYILHEGRIIMEGTPQEIVANKQVRKVYLGEDFTLGK
jgi:lipopolysaccharide export system ATP-binding protein